jgi:hypothetical protein
MPPFHLGAKGLQRDFVLTDSGDLSPAPISVPFRAFLGLSAITLFPVRSRTVGERKRWVAAKSGMTVAMTHGVHWKRLFSEVHEFIAQTFVWEVSKLLTSPAVGQPNKFPLNDSKITEGEPPRDEEIGSKELSWQLSSR